MKIIRSAVPMWFFSHSEKKMIVEAIKQAEKATSGEIRVHLERKIQGDILTHAKRVFEKLHMTHTESRNGVLVFFAVKSKRFALIGDTGINEKVPEDFWRDIVQEMESCFLENRFAEGLSHGILRVGEKLKEYFPYDCDDVNELSDAISFSL